MRDVFDKARAAALCVLFFDELDSIAKSSGEVKVCVSVGVKRVEYSLGGCGSYYICSHICDYGKLP